MNAVLDRDTDAPRHARIVPPRALFATDTVTRASWRESGLLWLLLQVAAQRDALSYWLSGDLFGTLSPMQYHAGTIAFNYFEFGAVRRGMGGSIVHHLASDLQVGTMRFHLVVAAGLAAVMVSLYRRVDAPWPSRVAHGAVLAMLFLSWGRDFGRLDMAVVSCCAVATVAMLHGRLAVAVACVCFGLFLHETAFMFGLPLIAALLWRLGLRQFPRRQYVAAAALFVLTLAVYIGMSALPHLGHQAMVDAVRAKLPSSKVVDWAIYFALSGFRGVETSICQNLTDRSYWAHPAGGLLAIIATYLFISRRVWREWPAVALAALPAFVLLSIIANDISRWTMFACANVWLVQAATGSRQGRFDVRPTLGAVCAMLLALSVNPRLGWNAEVPIYAGASYFEHLLTKYGLPHTPTIDEALARCDPYWIEVLGDAWWIDP